MVTVDDVRAVATGLPRSSEALVRGRIKFRIGRIVYLAFSRDETLMGFAFPREWREGLIAAQPEKFLLPRPSDLRYNWVVVRLAAIDVAEMHDLVLDAWEFCVPKRVAAEYLEALSGPSRPRPRGGGARRASGADTTRDRRGGSARPA